MSEPLSDAEVESLTVLRGGIGSILGGEPSPADAAGEAARLTVEQLLDRYPNRVERLLVISAMHRAVVGARSETLTDVLGSRFQWRPDDEGTLCSLAWNTWETNALAEIAGVTPSTMRRRAREVAVESHERARSEQRP